MPACRGGQLALSASLALRCEASRRVVLSTALALAALAPASRLAAADRDADFVAALRERGWNDTAVAYLDWVEKSPVASPEFRKQAAYERAVALAGEARESRSRSERARLLADAAASFERFAGEEPIEPAALDALRQAANVHAEHAIALVGEAAQLPPEAIGPRSALQEQARAAFDAAARDVATIVESSEAQLASLPKPKRGAVDDGTDQQRAALENRKAEGEYLTALLSFERSKSFPADSKERRDELDDAAKQFGDLVKEYGGTLVGASSRFYSGRCAQEQGEFEEALKHYDGLIRIPTADPAFRRWTANAHRRRIECYLALKNVDDAIGGAEDFLTTSSAAEMQQAEWLETGYRLAEAYQAKFKELGDDSARAKRLKVDSQRLMQAAAEHPNEFQKQAELALAAAIGRGKQTGGKEADPRLFADALVAARKALELMNSAQNAVRVVKEKDPDAVADIQKQADQHKREAKRLLGLALDLAEPQTAIQDVNTARYYLCWLHADDHEYYDAAALGEFLAERYPEGDFAESAAQVALGALQQIAREAPTTGSSGKSASSTFAVGRIATLAELMAARWPKSPSSTGALNVLISIAIREGRIADAEALLAKLPESNRASAEVNLGIALWEKYLQAAAASGGASADETAQRDKAGGLLARGHAAVEKSGAATPSGAACSLYYAQYLLAQGDAPAAVAVLEKKAIGPLTLIAAGDPAAARVQFLQEALKTAIRAYLSLDPPNRKRAVAMMEALERSAPDNKAGSRGVTSLYLGVGAGLKKQLAELVAKGDSAKAEKVAAAFADVLDRVAARPDANDWSIRVWLAQTHQDIGEALGGETARAHFEAASKQYQAILDAAAKDAKYAPGADALFAVRLRLARMLSAGGYNAKAVAQYAELIKARPNTIDLQKAAAAALQTQGIAANDAEPLEQSIHGTMPQGGKNLIWGWLQISKVADAQQKRAQAEAATNKAAAETAERFKDLFYEARYHMAKSRFEAAKLAQGTKRTDQLKAAEQGIELLRGQYPELGSPERKAEFDKLLAEIKAEAQKP